MLIFLNNIPFLFFPGKLSVLNAVMEYRFRYFSARRAEVQEVGHDQGPHLEENREASASSTIEGDIVDGRDDVYEAVGDAGAERGQTGNVMEDCDSFTYYAVCGGYITLILLSAIAISDLTLVFGLIGAFSETLLNFVFPGLFCLLGQRMVVGASEEGEQERQGYKA